MKRGRNESAREAGYKGDNFQTQRKGVRAGEVAEKLASLSLSFSLLAPTFGYMIEGRNKEAGIGSREFTHTHAYFHV